MKIRILDVWQDNLESAMAEIEQVCITYPFVSMDTEFPGTVAKPSGSFKGSFVFHNLRVNASILNIIQLGLTFSNEFGLIYNSIYQFNFRFDLSKDLYSQESIELLNKANFNFERHKLHGIDREDFSELFQTTGLITNPRITFLSFHSSYDFCYLLRIILGTLPECEKEFCTMLQAAFPNFYDIKCILTNTKFEKKGLQEIADELGVQRVGVQHQAGSDSFLTCLTYWKIKETLLTAEQIAQYKNKLYGIELKKNTL